MPDYIDYLIGEAFLAVAARVREMPGLKKVMKPEGILAALNNGSDGRFNAEETLGAILPSIGVVSGAVDGDPLYHWSRVTILQVVDLARDMRARFPGRRFVSIGNSPSYVVFAAECLAQQAGEDAPASYAAFSGGYLLPSKSGRKLIFTQQTKEPIGFLAAHFRDQYRAYLDQEGIHPRRIVDDFAATGVKTAFMDVVCSAANAMSFMHIMHHWAKDLGISAAFARATDCVWLDTGLQTLSSPMTIAAKEDVGRLSLPVELIPVDLDMYWLLAGNHSKDNDRFVPYYASRQWGEGPQAIDADVLAVSAQIKGWIADAAAGRLAKRVHLDVSGLGPQSLRQRMAARWQEDNEKLKSILMECTKQRLADMRTNLFGAPTAETAASKPKPKKPKRQRPQRGKKAPPVVAESGGVLDVVEANVPLALTEPVDVPQGPDEANRERNKIARKAAREILYAFTDMGDVLTQTHVDVLREVEGLRPNKEPVAVEVLAREVGVAPTLLWEHLDQAADFLTRRVSKFGGVDIAPADMAEALRAYAQSDEGDRVRTALWLDKGSEDAAAAVSDFSPEEIKKARMRVIRKMGDVLVDKIELG